MYNIVKTDLKNILRDPSLIIMSLVPLVMFALLRWGYPALLGVWPDATNYKFLFLAMFCMVGAMMPGIAIAFAMLDEKDQNLQVVLQILPVSFKKITYYRMGVIYVFGFLTAILMLGFTQIQDHNIIQIILLSALTAATAPIMALIPAFFAANKIEGATLTKLLNFLIMIPIPAFLFPGIWSWFLMIFPAWWVYFAFENTENHSSFIPGIAGGLVIHAIILYFLVSFIFRKMKSIA